MDDDFHYLVFPQTDGRARLYGAWDVADKHRYSGDGREHRFLESFRLPCFPVPDAIAGTDAGRGQLVEHEHRGAVTGDDEPA